MKTRALAATAVVLVLAACVAGGADRNAARRPPVLAGVPILPNSTIQDTSGTADAARAVLLVFLPPDSVAALYRQRLSSAGWRIVGDVADSAGTDIYAQREGPPLWIQIRRGPERGTTRYTIIGAVGGAPPSSDSAKRGAVR